MTADAQRFSQTPRHTHPPRKLRNYLLQPRFQLNGAAASNVAIGGTCVSTAECVTTPGTVACTSGKCCNNGSGTVLIGISGNARACTTAADCCNMLAACSPNGGGCTANTMCCTA